MKTFNCKEHLHKVKVLVDEKKYKKALVLLDEIKDKSVDYPIDFYIYNAASLMGVSNFESANYFWECVRNKNKNNKTAYIQGAICLRELNLLNESLGLLTEVIALDPSSVYPSATIQKGITLGQLGRFKEASIVFRGVRLKSPDNPNGFIEAAKVELLQNNYSDAAELLMQFDSRPSRQLLCKCVESIDDPLIYHCVLLYLISEKFDGKNPTVISKHLQRLFDQNFRLFSKYREFLSEKSNSADYFTLLALGCEGDINVDFVRKIFLSNNVECIKAIGSTSPFHKKNLSVIGQHKLYESSSDSLVRKVYENIFSTCQSPKLRSKNKNKLKIAVCVSGQLRGYKEAFKSWGLLGLKEHDVDYYCCVWDNIGRKQITKTEAQLKRVFPPNFVSEYLKYTASMDESEIYTRFPSLIDYINRPKVIKETDVSKWYGAKQTKVVNENDYVGKTNFYKMYFMIEQCWKLIDNPDRYDLIIRIRPDKLIENFNGCWHSVLNSVSNNDVLFADGGISIHCNVGYVIGDQFAVSTPKVMKKYSETFSSVNNREGFFTRPNFHNFLPHVSLCVSMMSNNIKSYVLPNSKFGSMLDPSTINPDVLQRLLENDFTLDNTGILSLFIDALNKDRKLKITTNI